MTIYLNEWDAYPAQWLRNLYPDAVVDETSITCLNTEAVDHDLSQYRQVHFFAGIGGWPEALRLAGWPEDVPVPQVAARFLRVWMDVLGIGPGGAQQGQAGQYDD